MRIFILSLLCIFTVHGHTADRVLVAAASNLTRVLDQIETEYRLAGSLDTGLVYGSSGNLSRQIRQGAPYDIFISASKKYIDHIQDSERKIYGVEVFANGSLSLFVTKTSHLYRKTGIDEVLRELHHGDFELLAIPNPEHAPYGIAAKQALHTAGVWAISSNRLILGENAAQAMHFCLTGNIDACIVPRAFALHPDIRHTGKEFPLPAAWHEPVTQYIALLNDTADSRRLFEYLLSGPSKSWLRKYGYTVQD